MNPWHRITHLGRPARGRGRRADSRGQALVELALVLPVLLLVLVAAGDLARVFAARVTIESAARAGALEAATHPSSFVEDQPCDAVSNRVMCAVLTESGGGAIGITPTDVAVDCYDDHDDLPRPPPPPRGHLHRGPRADDPGDRRRARPAADPAARPVHRGPGVRHDRHGSRPDRGAAEHLGRHADARRRPRAGRRRPSPRRRPRPRPRPTRPPRPPRRPLPRPPPRPPRSAHPRWPTSPWTRSRGPAPRGRKATEPCSPSPTSPPRRRSAR